MPSAPPPSRPPEPEELADEAGSFVLRFGTGVGVGALAAAAASVPAAMRVSSALGAGAPNVWVACVATMLFPMLLAVMVLRRSRVGLRALAGPDATARSIAVALWLFLLFVFEAVFGSVLRATTHHHALAGTTFAIVSLGVAFVLAILCTRFATIVATRGIALRRFLVVVSAGLLVIGIVVAGLRFARAFGGGEPGAASPGALFVDLLAFGIAAVFASRPSLAQRRGLALAGPPVAAALFAIGLWSLRSSSAIVDGIGAHAPALAPLARLLAGH